MNSLYHAFDVGFNWYFVVGPALLALAMLIGWIIPRVKRNRYGRLGVRTYVNEKFGAVVATPLATIFGVMLFIESRSGIVQWFDNHLMKNESGDWSLLFAGASVVAVSMLVGALYYGAFCFGRSIKINQLCRWHHLRKRVKDPYRQPRISGQPPKLVVYR